MESRYWQDKWVAQDIRFHRKEPNPNLKLHAQTLPAGLTFVPLCGKSLDLKYLAELGHTVVGAELSPIACESFFRENELPFTQIERGSFTLYQGESITLWCGDLFDLPGGAYAGITAIYDRASLVALPPDVRLRYAKKMTDIATSAPKLTYLLVTFEYDQAIAAGPPFSVPEAEVHSLFDAAFTVTLLERHNEAELRQQPKFQSAPTLTEAVYRLTKRN